MKSRVRVLFVGPEPADASLLELVLGREHPTAEVVHVANPMSFGRELERGEFDLLVCDEALDWARSTTVLVEARRRCPSATVVIMGGEGGLEATREGAAEIVLSKSSAAFLELPALLEAALERRRAEDSADRLSPRIRGLLERSRVGVFRLALDGRLLEADETFLRILGARSLEEAQQLDLAGLTPKLPRGFTESGKVYKREQRLESVDGRDLWVAVTEVVGLDEDGLVVLDGLLEDIDDRKRTTEDLSSEASKLAKSNQDLSLFASVAAHELKEPLRTIEQSTRLLLEEAGVELEGEAARSAEHLVEGVGRLQSMIEGLLTLARFGGGQEWVESCDCNQIVEEVLAELKGPIDDSGAKVRVRPLPTVHADPTQLALLFRNLFSNAIRFRGEAPPRIRVSARQDGEQWIFAVEDEGVGIAPERAEKIFDRFTRGDDGGAGLGLAISKQVVERHGGRIWVESEPGEGATFFFTLPLSASGGSQSDGTPSAEPPSGASEGAGGRRG
ncbi:MAG: ATP-binding protein [Thermoanaerobaculia bacterium]|nr:ATP-binding protein [Thermoanaerobaculia bacterium]